jgi:hypothetical protein
MKIHELLEGKDAGPKPEDFVDQHYDNAKAVGDQLGVDPKLILGHWALETGWGKSIIPGTNNLGNVKDFSGKGVRAYDKVEKSNDAYKVYDSPEASATAYADLLKRRFPGVVGAGSDQDAFVQGLQGGKLKYAGDDFAKVYAGMPASVEKYLSGKDWQKDPKFIAQKIKDAPKDIKSFVASQMPAVGKFVDALTSPFINTAQASEPNEGPIELIIDNKKRRFKTQKAALAALQKAYDDGLL